MPELAKPLLMSWWRQKSPTLLAIIEHEEACEDWTVDQSESQVLDAALKFGKALDQAEQTQVDRFLEQSSVYRLRLILAYLSAPRRHRLFSWFSARRPDVLRGVLHPMMHPPMDDTERLALGALHNSLALLRRERVLAELFSRNRLMLILDALTSEDV